LFIKEKLTAELASSLFVDLKPSAAVALPPFFAGVYCTTEAGP